MNRFLNWLCPNFRQALDNTYEQMHIPVSKAQINELNAKGLLLADSIDEDVNNANNNQSSQPIHQENIENSSDPSIQPDMNASDSLPPKSNQNEEESNSPIENAAPIDAGTNYSKGNLINPDEAPEPFVQNLQTKITPDIELVNQENLEKKWLKS